jgi:uncharacterized protein YciI
MRARSETLAVVVLILGALASAVFAQETPEKQWVYRIQAIRPEMLKTGPTTEERGILQDHFNYLKDLTKKGVVIFAGRTLNDDESGFGIVVFRAASEDAARNIMNGDPAVHKGVMSSKLFPFHVVLREDKPVE